MKTNNEIIKEVEITNKFCHIFTKSNGQKSYPNAFIQEVINKCRKDIKVIRIEIRQQNENAQLYNVYVGYDKKTSNLHSMALSFAESERLGFNIIKMNKDFIPQIIIDKY